MSRLAALVDQPVQIAQPDVLALHPQLQQHVEAGDARRAAAGGDDLDVLERLARDRSALVAAAPTTMAVPCWSSWKTGMFIRSRQSFSTMKQSGALMSSRLIAPKVGSSAQTISASFLGVGFVHLDVEAVDVGEFLEQNRLALHHRLGGQRADIAQPQHGGAVGDHGHEVAARGVAAGVGGSALISRQASATPGE
jgi:hypothetical protein